MAQINDDQNVEPKLEEQVETDVNEEAVREDNENQLEEGEDPISDDLLYLRNL